jgi:uroporphyrinogen-III synthase
MDPLVSRLRTAGLRVHAVPTVAIERIHFEPPDLATYDWVVVTSAAGAAALLGRTTPAAGPRWAAVGPRTATALAGRGVEVAVVPELSAGLHVVAAIRKIEDPSGRRVLLARADAAAGDLPDALRAAGALVEELSVYHTVEGPEASRQAVAAALADPALALTVLASGSAARGLLRLAERDPRPTPVVTIGPATTRVARALGFTVVGESARPDTEALATVTESSLRW